MSMVRIVLMSIFVHLGVVTDEECDSQALPSAVPVDPLAAIQARHASLEDELARMQVQLEEAHMLRVETEAKIAQTHAEERRTCLENCFKTSHYPPQGVIIWTSKSAASTRRSLDCLEKKQLIPSRMASRQEDCKCHLITHESDRGGNLYLKTFHMLYTHGLSSRDVLMVDDSPPKMSLNHPFNGLYPWTFDPKVETFGSDTFLV
ncbi:hypothetical protein R1flu_010659 [Riccia fluitans]|uniref:FCP1 homology domain-containing protein n=1 Tax=Riccia fluitans TaxID=41844 RepID=A0ABD1Z8P5_9MARC